MKDKRKSLIIGVLAVIVLALGGIAFYYWYNNTYYVSTDDARVSADMVNVSPQITGKLIDLNIEEGDSVVKDQILARQQASGTTPSNIEQSLVRSPISGVVIKKQGTVGEIWSPGQTLAMLVDPHKLYITADVEETKLGKVRPGQRVDITIDQFGSQKFTGYVKYVGKAAESAFSLLPTSTSGTFTKTVQRIPVKIYLNNFDTSILPGTNAVIKIHVK